MKYQNINLFKLPKNYRGRSVFVVILWDIINFIFFARSPRFFYGFRNIILVMFGDKIGRRVKIRPTVKIDYPWRLIIGDDVWIGDDVNLYNHDYIYIGSDTVISQKSYILLLPMITILNHFQFLRRK